MGKQFKSYIKFEQKSLTTDSKGLGVIQVSGWASKSFENGKPVIDRDAEHVASSGFDLTNAKVMLFNHNWDEPIGKLTLKHKPNGIWLEGKIHEAMNSKAFYAVKEGILDSFSIGFTVDAYEFIKVDGEDVISFTKGAIHEVSLVSIPANTQALIESTEIIKSFGKGSKLLGLQVSVNALKAMNEDTCISDFIDGTQVCKVTELTTEADNLTKMEYVKEYWNLGPEQASSDPTANPEYWQHMATVWNIPEAEARRQLCANCEYYDNTPEAMAEMDAIPQNQYDIDGGGRGYCHKFDFICHNLRTCQAWEKKEYENIDGEGMEEKSLKKDIVTVIKGLTFEETQNERWTQAELLRYFMGVLYTTIEDNFYESMWQDDMSPEDYKQNILNALTAFGSKLDELPILEKPVPSAVTKELKREFMQKEMETDVSEVGGETPPVEDTKILEGDENTPNVVETTEQVTETISELPKVEENSETEAPVEQSTGKITIPTIIGTLVTLDLEELSESELEAVYNMSADMVEKIESLVKDAIEGDE